MVKYKLTKKGKVVVVLLCSFMLLSVTLGVSLSKERPIAYDKGNADTKQNKQVSVPAAKPQPPASVQPEKGQAELNAEVLDKLKLSIFFDADAASLEKKYNKELADFIKAAEKYKDAKIQIEGNCATLFDNNKSKDRKSANFYLSLKRAQVIADYLKDKGIPPERIVVVANGSDKPLKDNDTPEGRKYNRRVDVFFLSK